MTWKPTSHWHVQESNKENHRYANRRWRASGTWSVPRIPNRVRRPRPRPRRNRLRIWCQDQCAGCDYSCARPAGRRPFSISKGRGWARCSCKISKKVLSIFSLLVYFRFLFHYNAILHKKKNFIVYFKTVNKKKHTTEVGARTF